MGCELLSTPPAESATIRGSLRPRAILYGYVARELLRPTCLALAAFTLVVLTRDIPGYMDLLINRGAGLARVASIVLYQSLSLMMSVMVSPAAQAELNHVIHQMENVNPMAAIEPGVVQRFGEWKLQAREVSSRNQALGRVLLWMPSIGETIFSETARIAASEDGAPEILIQNGVLLTSTRAMRFDELRTRIPRPQGSTGMPFEDRLRSMSFSALIPSTSSRASIRVGVLQETSSSPSWPRTDFRFAASMRNRSCMWVVATGDSTTRPASYSTKRDD